MTKNVILLKGKTSVKSIHLEYFSSSTSEENKSMASDWCNALNVCIDRANGRRISIVDGGSGSGSSPNNPLSKNTIKIIHENLDQTIPKKSS